MKLPSKEEPQDRNVFQILEETAGKFAILTEETDLTSADLTLFDKKAFLYKKS